MPLFRRKPPPTLIDEPIIQWVAKRRIVAQWTATDAVRGTFVLGQVGSGKTALTGHQLATSMMRNGYGGLVLTAKTDELENWLRWAHEVGREDSIRLIRPDLPTCCNFLGDMLDDEFPIMTIVKVFEIIAELAESSAKNKGGGDPFWSQSVKELLTHALITLKYSRQEKNLTTLDKLIKAAPKNITDLASQQQHEHSLLMQAMAECQQFANSNPLNHIQRDHLEAVDLFWADTYPKTPVNQGGGTYASYRNLINAVLTPEVKPLFTGTTTIRPQDCGDGIIQVMDFSSSQYGEAGRFAQVVYKYIWLSTMERRKGSYADGTEDMPCFLWVDESPVFVTKYDGEAFNRTRQARIMPVYLAQTKSQFEGRLGQEATRELLAALSTKIFHKMDDVEDRKWAAEVIGRNKKSQISYSMKNQRGDEHDGTNVSFQDDYFVSPYDLATLKVNGQGGVYERVFLAPDQRFAKGFGRKHPESWIIEQLTF